MNLTLTSQLVLVGCSVPMILAQSQGTFSPTGPLTTARMNHTATLLNTGKVLIAGGNAVLAGWPVWATAELYDPASGTFNLTGKMNHPRVGDTATLLPNGSVLVTGGDSEGGIGSGASAQASAEVYDAVTGAFVPTGDMLVGRSGHTATLLNTGKVLITGGIALDTQGKQTSLSSAELYDPVTGVFTASGSMAAGRAWHIAVLLPSGKVLVEGGNSCDSSPNPELYDPTTGQFTLTGPSTYPPPWGFSPVSASLLPNGNVLTTLDVGCDVGSGAEVYDSANGTFAATAMMTTDRGYNTATLLPEGRVLIDGRDFTHNSGSAELYDPFASAFAAIDDISAKSQEGHTATMLPDGSVLLAGGWICCGVSIAAAELYRPAHPAPSPVLYSLPGGSQGAILHAATQAAVGPANPAVAGEALEIYGAGLIDGGAIPPQVVIGGRLAEVLYFGRAPGFSGLNQINVRVPNGITPGSAAPVRLNYLSRSSNEVTIAVQ